MPPPVLPFGDNCCCPGVYGGSAGHPLLVNCPDDPHPRTVPRFYNITLSGFADSCIWPSGFSSPVENRNYALSIRSLFNGTCATYKLGHLTIAEICEINDVDCPVGCAIPQVGQVDEFQYVGTSTSPGGTVVGYVGMAVQLDACCGIACASGNASYDCPVCLAVAGVYVITDSRLGLKYIALTYGIGNDRALICCGGGGNSCIELGGQIGCFNDTAECDVFDSSGPPAFLFTLSPVCTNCDDPGPSTIVGRV